MHNEDEQLKTQHNWNKRVKKPAWPMYLALAILTLILAYLLSSA